MVSNFIVERSGYFRHEEKAARLCLETQKDGYFNSDMFLKQIDSAQDVFDHRFPGITGIFLFDNALSHRTDGLNPGGKQAIIRDTIWDGNAQSIPKGMKMVLQERGIDVLNADRMREKLNLKIFQPKKHYYKNLFIPTKVSLRDEPYRAKLVPC